MTRVSAVIPVYNGARTVGRAIESALDQGFEGLEVIVVDDGSTDSTAEVMRGFETQIRVLRQPNRGRSAARNAGVRAASGELIAFLDADDLWLPGKLGAMVEALDSRPRAVLAYSKFTPVDEAGRFVEESFFELPCDHAPSMNEMLSRWWPILTSTVVMRRETFERCGGFSEEFKAAGHEDPYLWLMARERGEFVYVPEGLALYRVEPAMDRIRRYVPGFKIFKRLVRRRYGRKGYRLVEEMIRFQMLSLSKEGMSAMVRGESKRARQAFALILRYQPRHFRSAMRWMRTFLPLPLVRALTGRARLQVP